MIYIAAITLLVLSRLIYRRGTNGCRLSIRLEKMIVFLAAILSIAAIVELGSFVASLFVREGDEFSGWLPGILAYPAGLILFLFIVLVVMPKPIPRNGPDQQDDADHLPSRHESDVL